MHEAASGAATLPIAAEHDVDLLLTDVVMPKMAGRQLAELLKADQPRLAVLYMSGYAQNILGPERVLDDGVALIQKPFDEPALLQSVDDALTAGAEDAIGLDAALAR